MTVNKWSKTVPHVHTADPFMAQPLVPQFIVRDMVAANHSLFFCFTVTATATATYKDLSFPSSRCKLHPRILIPTHPRKMCVCWEGQPTTTLPWKEMCFSIHWQRNAGQDTTNHHSTKPQELHYPVLGNELHLPCIWLEDFKHVIHAIPWVLLKLFDVDVANLHKVMAPNSRFMRWDLDDTSFFCVKFWRLQRNITLQQEKKLESRGHRIQLPKAGLFLNSNKRRELHHQIHAIVSLQEQGREWD